MTFRICYRLVCVGISCQNDTFLIPSNGMEFSLPFFYHTAEDIVEHIPTSLCFAPLLCQIWLCLYSLLSLLGSLITLVVGEVQMTVLPGARVSHIPLRPLFDLLVTFLSNFSLREVSDWGIGLVNLGWILKRDTNSFFLLLYLQPASTCSLFIASRWRYRSSHQLLIRCRPNSPQQGQYQRLNSNLYLFKCKIWLFGNCTNIARWCVWLFWWSCLNYLWLGKMLRLQG